MSKQKEFWRSVGRHLLYSLHWLIKNMPEAMYKCFKNVFLFLAYMVLMNKKKTIRRNLDLAYGDSFTEVEKKRIMKDCLRASVNSIIDIIYYTDHTEKLDAALNFEGQKYLDQALSGGKGAILVGAHFGNFIMMYWALVRAGYKVNVIMKRARDPEIEEYISIFRQKWGIQTIYDLPSKKCVVECIKCLRRNEVLFILMDQNFGGNGRVFVDFFGRPAATASGPVAFSSRTGAPVLPVFIHDGEDRSLVVSVREPTSLEEGNDEVAVKKNVQILTNIIEDEIRKTPHEWAGWLHKRWKAIPKEEQAELDRQSQAGLKPERPY